MPNDGIFLRMTPRMLERVDAQGRGRAPLIKAATEYYLRMLETGRELDLARRVEKVALLDQDGNVIKVL